MDARPPPPDDRDAERQAHAGDDPLARGTAGEGPDARAAEIEALVGDEMPAGPAAALRARAADDADLRARIAAAERLETTLRAEPLLPVPLPLVGQVLARLRVEPRAAWERATRGGDAGTVAEARSERAGLELPRWARVAAAAVLVAAGAWLAVAGIEPASAAAATVGGPALPGGMPLALTPAPALSDAIGAGRPPSVLAGAALPDAAHVALASATSSVPGGSTTLLLGGAATLLGGALLAAKRPRKPARKEPAPKEYAS